MGILGDVSLQVGKFFTPYDFVIIEMEEDSGIPIILGRPFLGTAGAMIDLKNGKLSLQVGIKRYNLVYHNPWHLLLYMIHAVELIYWREHLVIRS